jgi:prepilin-type N-terminal cleavage/methylation domain-containing protein
MMTALRHPGKQDQGFTLLEVLVAMVVMAVVVVTLLQMQSGTLRLAGAGRFTGMVPFLADRQLAALAASPTDATFLTGDFGPEYPGLEWTCTLEDAVFEDPVLGMDPSPGRFRKIQLQIASSGTGRSHTLTTWRYLVAPRD